MKTIKKLLPLLLVLFIFQSCTDEENDVPFTPTNNIIDVAVDNQLNSLLAALNRAGLTDTLRGNGTFTVFAPTNEAFQELLNSNPDWNTIDDVPIATLQSVLLFHVLGTEVLSTSLSDTYVNTLSTGPNSEPISLQLQTTGGVQFNNDPETTPIAVDVNASNGVVHVINKVMLPPNVVTLALNNTGFTTLVAALTDSRHTTNFVEVLNGNGPFTIFAPTNQAFQNLLESNTAWNSLGDIPIETLESVLLYHVISGANVQADQLSNRDETTLGGEITFDLTNGAQIITSSAQSVNIIVAPNTNDVQGTNGVIHAVEEVLIPINVTNTIVNVAVENGLTSLVDAVIRADLGSVLSGVGNYTVFAPTNDAFDDLLNSNSAWSSIDDIPVETLRSVLLFHVLGTEVNSTQLSNTYVNTLSTGPNDEPISLQVEVTGAIEFNGDATPTTTLDVEATNGIVHVINKVMLPPNLVTLALNNNGFTSLVAALTDSRHTTNFVEVLNGSGPFTVFAPTNEAFQNLLNSDPSWNSIGDIPIATLEAVLKYHVIDGLNVQANQLANGDVPTLGGDITIDLTTSAQIKTTSNQTIDIVVGAATNDVQGTNGVIHAISGVLLP